MTRLKIITVGNSEGVVLTKEMVAKLRVEKGDTLLATETPNGVELSAFDADVERQLRIAAEVMREDREALRRLAG